MACKYGHAIHVLSVLETTAPEQQVFSIKWHYVLSLRHLDDSFKLIDGVVRFFALDVPIQLVEVFMREEYGIHLFVGLLGFQIGLSVQILRLNIADSFWIAGLKKHKVARNKLILLNLDNFSDSNILPVLLLESLALEVILESFSPILFVIIFVSLAVFERIFDHGYQNDYGQRQRHRRGSIRD